MMRYRKTALIPAILLLIFVGGCSSGPSSFVQTDADFSFVRRAAVLPFQNLSQDLHAGARMQSVFMASILERDALSMVNLGETLNAMGQLRIGTDTALTREQIIDLGKELQVDALFLGTVEEFGMERMSNDRVYVITATFSMVETQTGSLIWTSQVHENGTSFWRKLFGGGSASLFDVSQSTVNQALETLF